MQSDAPAYGDRRPIATRNRRWAQRTAAWLAARNISPNGISIAGMCCCIAAGIALAATAVVYHRLEWLFAAVGVQLRLTANMVDRMVAFASARPSQVRPLYNKTPSPL